MSIAIANMEFFLCSGDLKRAERGLVKYHCTVHTAARFGSGGNGLLQNLLQGRLGLALGDTQFFLLQTAERDHQ